MSFLSAKLVQFWLLLVVTCHVISTDATATEKPWAVRKQWQRMILSDEDVEQEQQGTLFPTHASDSNNTVSFRWKKKTKAPQVPGFEPGDQAAPFKVATLDGEFVYKPAGLQGPLIIHVFTNKSGFLECLWSSESSLSDLVQSLPPSAHVLFLSLDESAVDDVLWMRSQVIRAAMHSGIR